MSKAGTPRHLRSACIENEADELAALQRRIVASRACPRLVKYCRRVARDKRAMFREEKYWGKAVPGFGDPEAELLILGLAPAAHGANRTGRMFTGDRSGDFLIRALYQAGFANQPTSVHRDDGLKLRNSYITSVVHWAPPRNKPAPDEIRASLPFLMEELRLLKNLRAVLVLGRIAFDTFLRLAKQNTNRPLPPRSILRFAHGASYQLPGGFPRLFCSYHPSQQNTQTGKLSAAMFRKVLEDIRKYIKGKHLMAVEDENVMRRAIRLAKLARRHGDAPVGTVIICDRNIVSQGIEAVRSHRDIAAHAELVAIRAACRKLRTLDLSRCMLYTTAEPCFMCSFAIRQTHISRVIVGVPIPHKGGFSSPHPILTDGTIPGWDKPPDLVCGILKTECRAL